LTYVTKDEYNFPIETGTYDIVMATQVIEHVRKIWRWFPELARITKPGGKIVIIGPVSWGYHEVPVDCWRIYPEGMRALCEDAGLEVLESRWESLEDPHHPRHSMGVSAEYHSPKRKLFYKIFGPLGFPVERSYDTITIARKPVKTG
jgi:SAM-dependent methyltransferase